MSGPLAVAAFGAVLFVLWVVYWSIFRPDALGVALLASAVLATFLIAAWAAVANARRSMPNDTTPHGSPELSYPAALLGVTVALAALSTQFGPWLAYGSLAFGGFAVAGLLRELRAQRRHVRALEAERRGGWEEAR